LNCSLDIDCTSGNCSLGVCSPLEGIVGFSTNITQFGITWFFDKNLTTNGAPGTYQYGVFANGDYWVKTDDVTGFVNITSITPDYAGGRNGWMVNPTPGQGQGYDSRADEYSSSLVPSTPYISTANKSLIKAVSYSGQCPVPPNDQSCLSNVSTLTILDVVPVEGSFRPAYSGSDKTVRYHLSGLDYSRLAKLPITSEMAARLTGWPYYYDNNSDAILQVSKEFEGTWIDHLHTLCGRRIHPREIMPDYGQSISDLVGLGAIFLNFNYSNEEKRPLLVNMVQIGIDNYGVVSNGGGQVFSNDGGHAQGRKFPILLAGIVLDDPAMKGIGDYSGNAYTTLVPTQGHCSGASCYGSIANHSSSYIHFGEDDQIFYITQKDVDISSFAWNCGAGHYYSPAPCRDLAEYTSADIGIPEYGIRHATLPNWDGREFDNAPYWGNTVPSFDNYALAVHFMNATRLWNEQALFDYMDRMKDISGLSSYLGDVVWGAYRANYGCIWTRSDKTDEYSQGYYNCSNANFICSRGGTSGYSVITACNQYPNQRARDYDPCGLGC
jgi:hypothetical protein